jgi:hypothetical protein
LIRESPALDVSLKRQWIEVLPHLKAADQERLRAILARPPRDVVPVSARIDTIAASG